jgi:ketosteroid isomerase-like protein
MAGLTPRQVVERHFELYNDGTPDIYGTDRFLEMWSDEAIINMPATTYEPASRLEGKEQFRAQHEVVAGRMRNRRIEVREIVEADNRVAVRYRFWASTSHDLPGMPAGTVLYFDGADFYRVLDGLIAESTFVQGPLLRANQ